MAILGPLRIAPRARITQEVSESPVCRIQRVSQESQIPRGKIVGCYRFRLSKLLEEDG